MPAYSDNNTYIVNSGSSANCWHINGHIETIGQLATVKFEVEDDPEKNDWTARFDYYKATTLVRSVARPPSADVPDEKIVNGMTYKFDDWYTDHTYADKINAIDNEQIGENGRTFYGRYVPKYTVTFVYTGADGQETGRRYGVGILITRFRFPRGRRVCQTGRIPTLRAGITSTVRRCIPLKTVRLPEKTNPVQPSHGRQTTKIP